MSTHTPGPWKSELREGEYLISGITEGHQHFTAICRNEANARLIAAAPDLLEALKELRDLMNDVICGNYRPDSFTCQPADTAIAKVEGKS